MRAKTHRRGQGLVEYVLVVALIALVAVATLTGMGQTVQTGLLGNIQNNLEDANSSITGS